MRHENFNIITVIFFSFKRTKKILNMIDKHYFMILNKKKKKKKKKVK
jgi:hypothetical protein